ncbi:tRNA pseudouridine(55) synthase TruB [Vogesella urethralis]|uniref:tRNA pseudouridine(55) synthase TruB n=1 Tax=Vogesella urethralis TaxID=2592656 RepID=UPI001186CE52|nr:tRNA pseudouridine(55) synthase TruB [Vogesella urethralis]
MSAPRRVKLPINGVLLLDKPYLLSSNTALQRARWLYSAAKAGHTGVLDPLATGLLPVCLGEATKFSSYLLDADKGYRATVKFGAVTTTGDIEGEVVLQRPVAFDLPQLQAAIAAHTGPISQVPPMYSALKHQGKALYEYAREGIEIKREARDVVIHRIDLLSFDGDTAVIDVLCSKGTYIRTLAQDIGEMLGCGAHLTGLRRTTTGGFQLQDAITLEQLEATPPEVRGQLLLPVDVLVQHFAEQTLAARDADRFCHGQAVRSGEKCETMRRFRVYREVTREFLGLAEARDDGLLHPVRVCAAPAATV